MELPKVEALKVYQFVMDSSTKASSLEESPQYRLLPRNLGSIAGVNLIKLDIHTRR